MNKSSERVIGVDLATILEKGLIGYVSFLIPRPKRSLPNEISDIPKLDHTPMDTSFKNPLEAVLGRLYYRGSAILEVAEMIRAELYKGTKVYGITDILATRPRYEMTLALLKAANISLTDVYMTPKGIPGLLSKADSIRQLGITDHYEGNRRAIHYLAKLFPHIQFNYIDLGGLAPLSKQVLVENSNIRVTPIRELGYPHGSLFEEDTKPKP